MQDLYKILNVTKSASQAEVKKAYRTLAKKYHPDANKDNKSAADHFKKVTHAYSILSDKKQRGRYDRGEINADGNETSSMSSGFQSNQTGRGYSRSPFGSRSGGGSSSNFGIDDAEDLFTDFWRFGSGFGGGFGKGKRKQDKAGKGPRHRGIDINYEITIGFEESITGGRRRVGLSDGRELDVKVPEGIKDGQIIRLSGQGGPGYGGAPKGDAMIAVHVASHPYYRREDMDIFLELPISLDEAVLGGDIEVPTPRGRLTIRVPRGSSSGRRLRLKNKGVKKGTDEGHMYITLKVMLPSERDAELEKMIKKWGKKSGETLRKNAGLN